MSIPVIANPIIQNITSIKIEIPMLILNEKAYVCVLLYDDTPTLITTYSFELTQPDYNLWRDDEDLINYVCQKYNLQLS